MDDPIPMIMHEAGRVRKVDGEEMGVGEKYDQNTLFSCIKFSKN